MVDVSSTPKTSTCTNVSSTNTYLRNVKNEISSYRGTSYYYPQKTSIALIGQCLQELGFNVTVNNSSNYYNHVVLSDYSEDVCLQLWNSAASTSYLSFLYPRHISPTLSMSLFNNSTSCRATIRMLGSGAGKTKTLLLLGSTAAPELSNYYNIYFTEAKYLPTGEMKKAIIMQYSNSYYFYIYDNDWTFLPGFDSELTYTAPMNTYWCNLSYSNGYRYYLEPYTSYKIFQEQTQFPELPVASSNGLWEFPDLIYSPYGQVAENGSSEALKYTMTNGTIYQIGNKKYLCNRAGYDYYLYRVE